MSGIVMGPGEAVHRIAELRAPEVAERIQGGAAVILPLGSLETHGPQAPMGDFMLAEVIADSIAAAAADNGADTLVLPALPFGGEDFFAGVPGGISLSTPVLQSVIEETIAGLVRNGVRRILIVNGHGGNIPAVEAATRRAREVHDVIIPALHLWKVAGAWQEELGGEAAALGHGGDPVWSVALFLAPELCRPERARPREARRPFRGLEVTGFGTVRCQGVEFAMPIQVGEIAPGGVACEDSRGGSAAHGAAIVKRLVEAGAAMLLHLRHYERHEP
jgi:creatinine amidohydrolase